MARRARDWNEGLAKDLRDPAFAREFILAALGDGASLRETLAKVIGLYGVAEFSKKAHMASPNVVRALGRKSNPTVETLSRLLIPFGLELSAAPTVRKRRRAA
jgi:DNA-binding phage protein